MSFVLESPVRKLKLKVLESSGIYLWFKLTNVLCTEFGLLLTEIK